MKGLCVTSIIWGALFVQRFEAGDWYYPLGVFSLVWACVQLCGGIAFVVLQQVLHRNYRVKEAWQPPATFRQRTQLDLILELSDEDNAEDETDGMVNSVSSEKMRNEFVGSEQQKYRLIATRLRYVSFAVEALVSASVIALVTMNTIIRMTIENEIYGSRGTYGHD